MINRTATRKSANNDNIIIFNVICINFFNCILITTNDSRVRLFNMKDKSLMFKYKGILNTSLQIKATFRYFLYTWQ